MKNNTISGSLHAGAAIPDHISKWAEKIRQTACLMDARSRCVLQEPEAGMATAEYAIVLVAATGFAGLLVAILKSDAVRELLTNLVKSALSIR
ncbi:protein [Scardovia inopinata]|uniref:DUF4244 domain-containing protein n=1 Tax=Scardovia inopinata F0304 TaxID=641146 RepID=W5IGM9_SCAIO|nr:DUF4244 domain-containing protein [Scardovia inopinata]EFG25989.1 hypothetical protein HMPREF9020_01058 [Scardovia inopinata F0304]BAR07384.1 conserved hypothetical protein [Scardovia inopinata JCM 12537]SUV51458.1 protein [Scardovia inopinata]